MKFTGQSRRKAARPCKKYGVIRLRPDLYAGLNPMTYAETEIHEPGLATKLREAKAMGFGRE